MSAIAIVFMIFALVVEMGILSYCFYVQFKKRRAG